ncbi:MAG TPA: hypothetical protein VGP06_07035 [Janthinobacterium sp.]|nr:hypothetical protein [Janthinobacterium sp.]
MQSNITLGQLQYACDSLNRLYQACHWRKIEMYLIPAIRQVTQQADRLLDELGTLNKAALEILTSLQARVGNAAAQNEEQLAQFCAGIDAFCSTLLQRLEKEERELFVIARRAICGEAWFNIANQFLRHDAQVEETRRNKSAAAAPALPLPPPAALERLQPEACVAAAHG